MQFFNCSDEGLTLETLEIISIKIHHEFRENFTFFFLDAWPSALHCKKSISLVCWELVASNLRRSSACEASMRSSCSAKAARSHVNSSHFSIAASMFWFNSKLLDFNLEVWFSNRSTSIFSLLLSSIPSWSLRSKDLISSWAIPNLVSASLSCNGTNFASCKVWSLANKFHSGAVYSEYDDRNKQIFYVARSWNEPKKKPSRVRWQKIHFLSLFFFSFPKFFQKGPHLLRTMELIAIIRAPSR